MAKWCETPNCKNKAQFALYKLDPVNFTKRWVNVCRACDDKIAAEAAQLRMTYPDARWIEVKTNL